MVIHNLRLLLVVDLCIDIALTQARTVLFHQMGRPSMLILAFAISANTRSGARH
jgi:hypothetical protein